MRPMRCALQRSWPWILTVALLLVAVGTIYFLHKLSDRALVGDFVSGFAGAAALIWLVAGYVQQNSELRLQRKELQLQRKELKLQRHSMELQREEMVKLARHSALAEIYRILDRARQQVREAEISGVKTPADLIGQSLAAVPQILESFDSAQNTDQRLELTNEWMKFDLTIRQYLGGVASAARLLAAADPEVSLANYDDVVEFVHFNKEQISRMPHLEQEYGVATGLALHYWLLSPARDELQYRCLLATQEISPNGVKQEAIDELRVRIEQRMPGESRE